MEQQGNSRSITSNQNGIHDDLDKVVNKHLTSEFKKPYAQHSLDAFAELKQRVTEFLQANPNGQLILDSCCGVAESTYQHARNNPECLVIGIDKSEHRIDKQGHHGQFISENVIVLRADLNDLWRLIAEQNWPIKHHFILYPNPWPKSKHLQRRWHGAAVFPYIAAIGGELIVRSNWDIYIAEFQQALSLQGHKAQMNEYVSEYAVTPFERKYWASGQQSYQLICQF